MKIDLIFDERTVVKSYVMLTGEVKTYEQIVEEFGGNLEFPASDAMGEQSVDVCTGLLAYLKVKNMPKKTSKFEQRMADMEKKHQA